MYKLFRYIIIAVTINSNQRNKFKNVIKLILKKIKRKLKFKHQDRYILNNKSFFYTSKISTMFIKAQKLRCCIIGWGSFPF